MAIPLVTTSITITGVRPQASTDPLVEGYPDAPASPDPAPVATDVPASISIAGASSLPKRIVRPSGDDGPLWDYRMLRANLCDLTEYDTVTDETTGLSYAVVWATHSRVTNVGGVDLSHTLALLRIRKGV